jgi:FAD/FMN-containing dehydrogenase
VFEPKETLKYFIAQSCTQLPAIHVLPENAKDVSIIVRAAAQHQQPFAVKAGGHGVFAGASSISGGLLIDLARINKTEVAADRNSAWVGAGAKWGPVYEELNRHGLSIPGGRISTVGVGGLTLGGGISFAANRYGLACDNVKTYEVCPRSQMIFDLVDPKKT